MSTSFQTTAEANGWCDLTLSMDELVTKAARWTLYLALATFVPYVLLWGLPALPSLSALPQFVGRALLHTLLFVLVYGLSVVVHEGLHAAAMVVLARVPPRTIRFRARWREGIAYVHTGVPMSARAYRGVLVLPGLVQGVLPTLAGLGVGSGWLTFYGFVMLASSIGDVAVLRRMRPLGGHTLVRDHPSEVGLQVRCDVASDVRDAG